MSRVQLPYLEEQRIASLYSLSILDTESEAELDALVALASTFCDTPIALLSFIDADRQWFKSRLGLEAREISRDTAFCAHTILDPSQPLVVNDATKDVRFADNPLVTVSGGMRFYAGVPLVTRDGNAVGTLCVFDRVVRSIAPHQVDALSAAAAYIMLLLEKRSSDPRLRLLEVANVELQAEILERKRIEIQLNHAASHDGLTNLPNRTFFKNLLHKAINEYQNAIRKPCRVVCFIDLDYFKKINDTHGHKGGDTLLLAVASRLRSAVRPSDLVARFAGDEFTVLFSDIEDPAMARDFVDRLGREFTKPFHIGTSEVSVTASIGATFIGVNHANAEDTLLEADLAMFAAKDQGRTRVVFFSEDLRPADCDRFDDSLFGGKVRLRFYRPGDK